MGCAKPAPIYKTYLYTVLYIHYVAWSPVLLSPLFQNSNLFLQLLNSQQVISTSLPFHTYLLLFHVPALLEEAALRWFFKQKINPHHEGQQNEVKDGFLSEAQTCTWTSSHSGGVVVLLFYVKCLWMTASFRGVFRQHLGAGAGVSPTRLDKGMLSHWITGSHYSCVLNERFCSPPWAGLAR